jgi:hypothetical protein
MANSNRGNKNGDVADKPAVDLADEPASVAKTVVAPKPTLKLNARVQETLDSAMKGGKVKIKSKANYDAAKQVLKDYNPKGLTLVHKPGLGHHSIATR